MGPNLYVGVDGGATKTIVRVETENGDVLGKEIGGPANIRISVAQTWHSIHAALKKILSVNQLQIENTQLYAAFGLAGCEMTTAYQAFLATPHPFKSLLLTSDAHIACLGAHQGKDGAIIIAGTGVIGFQIQQGQQSRVGGWGFPHDDIGGGAWLGLEATKLALQHLDGRIPASGLSAAIYQHFNHDRQELVAWANTANSTAFAELAPLVIAQSNAGDEAAIALLKSAAEALNQIGVTLQKTQAANDVLPCSLIGSITPFLEPFLDETLRARLSSPKLSPDAGAVLLARNQQE